MITIYCEELNPRVQYTFDLVFTGILKTDFEITSDKGVYVSSQNVKFVYGNNSVDDGLFVRAAGLLSEKEISAQHFTIGELEGHPAFYKVKGPSALDFDLFSAIFYLVSRYEEYLPSEKDEHGRYRSIQSVACQNGFIESPVVDIWAQLIARTIKEHFPNFKTGARTFQYINTIDIDNAYAYVGKGGIRTAGGMAKSALKLDKEDIAKRLEVLGDKAKDPYDTYEYMKVEATKYQTEVKSFVLMGDYGPYDKNLPHSSAEQVRAVENMAEFSDVGLHPSYGSSGDVQQVLKEMKRLSEILGRPVKISRQHYLKLKIPDTYRILINCGIEEDHSMGYSEMIGFRAGTCTPFYFYDLELETSTDLMVYPFAVMDRTLNDYMKLNPDQAIERIGKLVDEVKAVDGMLISVWHNESLSDEREWSGWLPVYEYLQRLA